MVVARKYLFFRTLKREGHPVGKRIVDYYSSLVGERCKQVYELQKKGYTIAMI
jgi:hypothetical protein